MGKWYSVICVELCLQTLPTFRTASPTHQRKNEPLARGESAPHRLTQYSVNMISRIGRLGGGVSAACLFIRTIAVA